MPCKPKPSRTPPPLPLSHLVVPHEDLDPGLLGHVLHPLQLRHGRRAGLLEVDALAPRLDALREEAGVVGGPAGDERDARLCRLGEVGHGRDEAGAVLGRCLGGPFVELGPAGSLGTRSQEPSLDDVVERGRRTPVRVFVVVTKPINRK